MIGTMQSAATGSAHHQPNAAFNNTPASAIIDKYAHKDVWRASARRAPLCIAEATFNLARARRGMTTTDMQRMTMPAIVLSGRSRSHRVLAPSTATYTPRFVIRSETPLRCSARAHLDETVDAEADERNATGKQSGNQ
jgi:hypothetical protein